MTYTEQAFASITEILEKYAEENSNRTRVTGYNKDREKLFNDLLAALRAADRTNAPDDKKLKHVKQLLITAQNDNNALEKTSKDSGEALDQAINIVNASLVLVLELLALEQEEIIERQAGESKYAEGVALRAMHMHNTEFKKQSVAIKKAQEQSKAALEDPLALVTNAIREKRFQDLNLDVVVSRLHELMTQGLSDCNLSVVQQAFYRDVESELKNRQLAVSTAVVTLIAHSPLADRHAALVAENRKNGKTSSRELRTMISSIADILRICLLNQNGLFQDLHSLLTLQDEKELRVMLSLLEAKNRLTVNAALAIEMDVMPKHDVSFAKAVSDNLAPTVMAASFDIDAVDHAVQHTSEIAAVATTQSAPTLSLAKITAQINDATNQFVHVVKLTSTISLLIEEIMVNNQALVHLSHIMNDAKRFAELGRIGQDLQPQFRLLIALMDLKRRNKAQLNAVMSALNDLYQRQQAVRSLDIDQAITRQIQQLQMLLQNYAAQHKADETIHMQLRNVLSVLNGVAGVEPTVMLNAATNLQRLSEQAQAEEELKLVIRRQVEDVLAMTAYALQNEDQKNSPDFGGRFAEGILDEPQALSLEFLTKLANKMSVSGDDCESAIDLVRQLQVHQLFTRDIQNKLLHQNNFDVLLSLQNFLYDVHVAVTSVELCRLWDNLHGAPHFDLLKQLKTQLQLSDATVIKAIENLSRTWQRSLAELTVMFRDKKSDCEIVFSKLIDASKNDQTLIEKVYKIFDAITTYQPTMLNGFFNASRMQKLIDSIALSDDRFADEVVLRLQAAAHVPFSVHEDFDYLLDRTKQYVDRNLSYVVALEDWKKTHNVGQSFDAFSSLLLAGFEMPRFDGATQINVKASRTQADTNEPPIADISAAQWTVACAYARSLLVRIDDLKGEVQQALDARVNLDPTQQFLLQLMQMTFQPDGVLIQDRDNKPSFVAWLPAGNVSSSARFMDSYVYLTIQALQHELAVFMNDHKDDEDFLSQFALKKSGLIELAASAVRSAFNLNGLRSASSSAASLPSSLFEGLGKMPVDAAANQDQQRRSASR